MCARVSVILPAFNAAETLGAAIASVRAQTFRDWELLVVDDGSTDRTVEIARQAGAADARISVVSQPHAGVACALNTGLTRARGDYVARMDADDIAFPPRLARQIEFLDRSPAIGLCACLVEFGGDAQANAGYALHVEWINSLISAEDIALNRFIESPLAHPSVVFRRALVDQFGGYAEGDFPEDYELWLRWLGSGVRMAKVPEVLLRWNDRPSRLSRSDRRYAPEKFYAVKARWIAAELRQIPTPARQVWIWGAGRNTRKRAEPLGRAGVVIAGYIDIDPKKTGHTIMGRPVIGPDALPSPGDAFVLGYVATRGARDVIRPQLRDRGYHEGRDFLMCA